MNMLEELYYGNIDPSAKCYDRKSEYAKFQGMIVDGEQELTAFLKALPQAEKEQQTLARIMNAQNEIIRFMEFERFGEGFRIGTGLMLEAFIVPQQSVLRDIC
ncbi:MAG: hypothetical protein FWE08_04345 [Oscillospiraceae bacterium]|nr:hypothetical protein [Oscillospiraceae bacterium]